MHPGRFYLALASLSLLVGLLFEPRARAADMATDPDERMLQEARVGADDASLLAFLRKGSASDADLLGLDALIRQLGNRRFADREQATQKLTALGAPALARLTRAVTDPDPEIARRVAACLAAIGRKVNTDLPLAAVRRLVQRQPQGTVEALLQYLPSAAGDEAVEEIVYGLYALAAPAGKVHPALVAALRDPLAPRRAAAACIVGRLGNSTHREAVRGLLADTDPMVRLRAAQGLLAAKEKAAVPVLIALLEEPAVELSWQAEELLHWVAEDDAPEVSVGAASEPARQRCRLAWEEWWRRHGARLDLAKLDQDHRRPGLVLVCDDVHDERQDAVWLCGCDGKPRWQLGNLSSVRDVRLLSGNRVLLAQWPEPGDEKARPPQRIDEGPVPGVSVRDLTGRILWQYTGVSGPLECRPLPQGNTLITGRHAQIAELAPNGRSVYFHDFLRDEGPVGSLEDPQGLGNGHLVARWHGRESRLEKLVEFEPTTGRVLKTVRLQEPPNEPCQIEALPNGHYLIAGGYGNPVLEFDATGQTVWRCMLPPPSQAARLRNGNTLVSSCEGGISRLLEVDPRGRLQWEAFTLPASNRFRGCLGLVRLGFDRPRAAELDLATSVPYRLQGLRNKDVRIRRGHAYLVRHLGPKAVTAIPVLIDALDDPDIYVRCGLTGAFVQFGPVVLPDLLKATKDKRSRVREHVAGALGEFSNEAQIIIPALLRSLEDENVYVRRSAVAALSANLFRRRKAVDESRITDAEINQIVPALVKALKDKDVLRSGESAMSVSQAAAIELRDLGPRAKAAIPALIAALKDDDLEIRGYALNVLGAIGAEAKGAVPDLLRALSAKEGPRKSLYTRNGCIWVIGQIGEEAKDAVPTLIKILQDKKLPSATRKNTAEALGKIGGQAKAAIPALTEARGCPDNDVQTAAAEALKRIGH